MRVSGRQILDWCSAVQRRANDCLYEGRMPLRVKVHTLRKYKKPAQFRVANPIVGVRGGGAKFIYIKVTVHPHHGLTDTNFTLGEGQLSPVISELTSDWVCNFSLTAVQIALKVHSNGLQEKLKKLGDIKSIIESAVRGL